MRFASSGVVRTHTVTPDPTCSLRSKSNSATVLCSRITRKRVRLGSSSNVRKVRFQTAPGNRNQMVACPFVPSVYGQARISLPVAMGSQLVALLGELVEQQCRRSSGCGSTGPPRCEQPIATNNVRTAVSFIIFIRRTLRLTVFGKTCKARLFKVRVQASCYGASLSAFRCSRTMVLCPSRRPMSNGLTTQAAIHRKGNPVPTSFKSFGTG